MDSKTILFVFSIISISIAFLFLFYNTYSKKKNKFLSAFALSKILAGAGVYCLSQRYQLSDYLSLNVGGALLTIGYALELFCVSSYDNVTSRKASLFFFIVSLFTATFLLIGINFPYHILCVPFYISNGSIMLFGAWVIFNKEIKTPFVKLVNLVFALYALPFFIAAVGAIYLGNEYEVISNSNQFESLIELVEIIHLVVGTIGYILILKEMDELEIQNQNLIIQEDLKLLEEMNYKKDTLFSIISHDLRNPMGAMLNLGQLLQQSHESISIEQRDEMISIITQAAKETFNLLDNLLQWSRTETGNLDIDPEQIALQPLIHNIIRLHQQLIDEKKINIDVQVGQNVHLFADKNMVQTIIRNLLSNAIKFVHEGGKISIVASIDTEHTSRITIRDNGVGIPSEKLDTLFDIDNTYIQKGTKNESGTGLGLKLCNVFAIQNNGKIFVESELDKGSSFTVLLPSKKN